MEAPPASSAAFQFEKLPYELIFGIIKRLDARKLCRIFTVCKFFASFAEDEELWKGLCIAHGAVSRPLDLREVWRLNSYRSLFIRVFRFPFCMSPYKLDQLPRTSLSKSRNIFLANAFRTKVVIEQHQQQLRLQVRPEIFVVRQLKHPNIIQLLCTSDSSVLGQVTDAPTSPKAINSPPLSIMTEYMPYSLKSLRVEPPTQNLSTVLRFSNELAAAFAFLLRNKDVIPADFLLFSGRSILLDEQANVKVLIRDVIARGSLSSDFLPPETTMQLPQEHEVVLVYLFGMFVALFATPARTPFLRPTAHNLNSFLPPSFPPQLTNLITKCLNPLESRPPFAEVHKTILELQGLVVASEVKVRVAEAARSRSLSDLSAGEGKNIRKSAEASPGKKQLKPGKQGPGAVVCELTEANSEEVKAFKELGEGATYKAYYGHYNSIPVTLRVLKSVAGDSAEKKFRAHIDRWLRVRPHKGFVRFLASCHTPPMLITQFVQWTLPQFLASTSADVSRRLVVLQDIAEALRYLHDNSTRAFRHLNPNKIVIDERFHALLCDAPAEAMDLSLPLRWSTAVYVPPEALGHLVAPAYQFSFPSSPLTDEQSWDVYSFGVLMWRVLANAEPADLVCPKTQTDTQILTSILYEHRRPPVARLETPLLSLLVATCWQADPSARPPFKAVYFRLTAAIPLETPATK